MIYFVCSFDSVDCFHYVALKKGAGHFILFHSIIVLYFNPK